MTKTQAEDVFPIAPKKPQSKTEITDAVARAIIEEEVGERVALTAKLKAARLAREAEAPVEKTVKRKVKAAPRFRKY